MTASSQVIYARVPSELKARAQDYADERGQKPALALAELIDKGLQKTETIRDLRLRVDQLEAELVAARGQLSSTEAGMNVLRDRQRTLESAYQALAGRLSRPLGACPSCHQSVTGRDLFVDGRCPNQACGKDIASLLAPDPTGFDRGEFLLLVGAVGLVLGIALIQSKNA
jgi:hypothetical protein